MKKMRDYQSFLIYGGLLIAVILFGAVFSVTNVGALSSSQLSVSTQIENLREDISRLRDDISNLKRDVNFLIDKTGKRREYDA